MSNKFEDTYPIDVPTERVSKIVTWYKNELLNPKTTVLRLPVKNAWQEWDDNRIWCSLFFSIVSPGASAAARKYLKLIENGVIEFELTPEKLLILSDNDRINAICYFGTGNNCIKRRLARFFSSKPEKIGSRNSHERRVGCTFSALSQHGFRGFLDGLNELPDDRAKAKALEFFPGIRFKVSRDFLNNIGMTDSLIPLDIHVLCEMKTWGWNVPEETPPGRNTYEQIEDAVRLIANKIQCTVVEIDKAIFFYRISIRDGG